MRDSKATSAQTSNDDRVEAISGHAAVMERASSLTRNIPISRSVTRFSQTGLGNQQHDAKGAQRHERPDRV
jgi:hypothetical protein